MSEASSSSLARVTGFTARNLLPTARRLWVWPLLTALLIAASGWWVRQRIDRAIQVEVAMNLQTVLKANTAALRSWFQEQQYDAKALTSDGRIQGFIMQLAHLDQAGASQDALVNCDPARALESNLKPLLESQGYEDYVVISVDRRILASPVEALVGRATPPAYEAFLPKALAGQLSFCAPFPAEEALGNLAGHPRAGMPTMFIAAPVRNTNDAIVAVLAMRMDPEQDFSEIFSVGRFGEGGDAYAFARNGLMLTGGRFKAQLRTMGLIPDRDDATPTLKLYLCDPGVDLRKGERPSVARAELPFTLPVRRATTRGDGFDVHGYRDYRGAPVVGAWTWLADYGFGIVAEIDREEAFRPLTVLNRTFFALFGVLGLTGLGILGFTIAVDRLQTRVQKSTMMARHLGQYVLDQEIGSGGNGKVYLAHHALLRRPVAVKLLHPYKSTEMHLASFEREVQATSQLTHPNTVAIYDYGHTPDGVFYCAMEFLNGISLDRLVEKFGPQPEGRVIHILRQICGSLGEAHELGLVHRDIKPGNIMLTRRGGICDVVKVLDFGLVKPLNNSLGLDADVADTVVGTPHFMSPEAIEKPESADPRSDLYSLGAVGYFLIVGRTLFDGDTPQELLQKQVHQAPESPSSRLGRAVDADLERLIMQCLEKDPSRRLSSACAVDAALTRCASFGKWTQAEATSWWQTHHVSVESVPPAGAVQKTLVILPRV